MKTNENELRMKNEDLAKLVAKAKGGDQAAFTELYDRTSSDLFRCIRAMTRDEDLTWDIQQDSYLRAFQNLDKLETGEAFFPWLRRIAVNVTADRMKQRLPLTFTELSGDEDDGMPELPDLNPVNQPELSLDRKETARLVKEILSQLPEAQQMIVGMRYYDELSIKEISELLKISDGTVKAQLFHGRKKVETAVRALEKQGVKLYGLSPLPFLLALMRQAEPTAASGARQAAVKAAVAKASADAVAATAVPVAAKTFGQVLTGRLLAGALAVALIGGGIWGGAKLLKSQQRDNPYQPTTVVTSERLAGVETPEELQNDPTAPTLPVELKTTEPTAPETEAPVETEAAVPESAANVSGEDEKKVWGMCGEALYWTLFKNSGELKLRGSGDMTDYPDAQSVPWYAYRSEIKELELPAELTGIGDYAFADCTALNTVNLFTNDRRGLPDGLTRIGNYAFSGCASFDGYEPGSLLPDTLTSIGDGAFSGCTGVRGMRYVILPENLSSVSGDAFSDCSGLRELWVLNRDCALDASLGLPSDITVCGFPGSTAEAFARENGYAFEPIVDNSEAVLAELSREENRTTDDDPYHLLDDMNRSGQTVYVDPGLRFGGIARLGTGYLTQVLRVEPACVTEEALRQAAQTGTIVLDGKAYPFTDSPEQARQWYNGSEGHFTADAEGWLFSEADDALFVAQQTDAGYCFCMDGYGRGECINDYVNTDSPAGWLMLDSSVPVKKGKESCTLNQLLQSFSKRNQAPDQFDRLLMLNARNELVLLMPWKR